MTTETKWSIDPAHSEIAFKVKHLMIAHVKGVFSAFDASIYTNHKDFTTVEVDLWIDAGSINTGDTKRDEHLKGADFFDVENYKMISFTSTTIEKPDEKNNRELWGELTMKGIIKKVKLNVIFGGIRIDPYGNEKAGFEVTGIINRNDWGLTWNTPLESGGVLVGEAVTISCELELINMGEKGGMMDLATDTHKEKAAVK